MIPPTLLSVDSSFDFTHRNNRRFQICFVKQNFQKRNREKPIMSSPSAQTTLKLKINHELPLLFLFY